MAVEFNVRDYAMNRLERATPSAGAEITAVCPRCEGWSCFYVNAESGAFVCFRCGFAGRSVVGLVAEMEGLGYAEARAWVFRRSVELRRRDTIFTLADRLRSLRPVDGAESSEDAFLDVPLPPRWRPVYREGKWSLPTYLRARGIRARTARAWGMGWCRSGRYGGRLVIPIECPAGRSWTARDMTGEQSPKYLNPKGADHRRLLIGWNVARLTGDIALVEGPLDAVKAWQADVSALALGGKELHDEQRVQLFELPPDTAITVMLDPEETTAPYEVAERLAVHFRSIFLARLPDGTDPGSASPAELHSAIERAERWNGNRLSKLRAALKKSRNSMDSRWSKKS